MRCNIEKKLHEETYACVFLTVSPDHVVLDAEIRSDQFCQICQVLSVDQIKYKAQTIDPFIKGYMAPTVKCRGHSKK